jgi:integrase
MIISQHKESGLWYFTVPAKQSETGRRKPMYYATKHKAEDGLAKFKADFVQHGKAAITEKEMGVVLMIRAKYSDFHVIEILEEYKRTLGNLKPIPVKDAVEEFIKRIEATNLNDTTKRGYRSRLRHFAAFLGNLSLHEVSADHIDKFLQTKRDEGYRKSYWKTFAPFFKHALAPAHWIAKNPMLEFTKEQKPKDGEPKRQIYSPEEYGKLLTVAANTDEYVTRYLVLAGMGFFRPEELIRGSATSEVLAWEDIQLDRPDPIIHVRAAVAKGTGKRGGDERYVELNENKTLLHWLRQEMSEKKLSGPIIPFSQGHFRTNLLNRVHATAGVAPKNDGLRKSAISYYLAMNSGTTVRQVAEWAGNSEAIILTYYLRYLRPEQGGKWFNEVNLLIKG